MASCSSVAVFDGVWGCALSHILLVFLGIGNEASLHIVAALLPGNSTNVYSGSMRFSC